MAFVYIVRCADGTLYTGAAKNLEKRIEDHNRGQGAKYTRGRLPVTLVYHEVLETYPEALSREKKIQQMSRQEKEELLKS